MSKAIDLRRYTKLVPTPAPEITKEQFFAYERTRMEGKVNMLDLDTVCPLTGLKPEDIKDIKAIQQNFQVLNQKFNKSWKSR